MIVMIYIFFWMGPLKAPNKDFMFFGDDYENDEAAGLVCRPRPGPLGQGVVAPLHSVENPDEN